MMITQILKKEHDKLHEQYDHKCPWKKCTCEKKARGFLLFKGADKKYYKVDGTGMVAVREWTEYNKNLKALIDGQTKLV